MPLVWSLLVATVVVLPSACTCASGGGRAVLDEPAQAAAMARRDRAGDHAGARRMAAKLLARGRDPVALSSAVRRMAKDGCDGMVAALAILDERATWPGAVSPAILRGLVSDVLTADGPGCAAGDLLAALAGANGAASALLQAALMPPDEGLVALSKAPAIAAIDERRGELLGALHRPRAAIDAFSRALAQHEDPDIRARLARLLVAVHHPERALAVATAGGDAPLEGEPENLADDLALIEVRAQALAAMGRYGEAAAAIARSLPNQRRVIAAAAAGAAPDPEALARAAGDQVAVMIAVADRVAADRGIAAAIPWRARAVALSPADAELCRALAEAKAAAGDITGAVAAWDRAAAVAPATWRYKLDPSAALVAAGHRAEAEARARALAGKARAAGDADALSHAATAAAMAKNLASAITLARAAQNARPKDGRLAFRLAETLAAGHRPDDAIATYAHLLACGAHGRPWHRHELAKRLVDLGRDHGAEVKAALADPGCQPVAAGELAQVIRRIGKKLDAASIHL
ncbi:MAG TPA: hypothetical protein VFG83_14145 [Kofleriaceae bacterium]|nr:hypothetical protein [Kofleriaceae bacterium]